MLTAISGALRAMISRGKLVRATRAKRLSVQVQLLNSEAVDRVEALQPYGFSSFPKPGGDVLMLTVGGLRDDKVIIAIDDPSVRIRDLAQGELGISDGATVIAIRTTGVQIVTPGALAMQSDGNATLYAPQVRLGLYGAAFLKLVDERFIALFNAHVHTDPQGGTTGAPTTPAAVGAQTTTNVQAS